MSAEREQRYNCVEYPSSFLPELVRHCEAGCVPPEVFRDIESSLHLFPRYVRIHPRHKKQLLGSSGSSNSNSLADGEEDKTHLLQQVLSAQLGLPLASIKPFFLLPCDVVGLPKDFPMYSNPLFTSGTLVPMDAASMAAVVALRPRVGERVLDVCCSPGMKLNLIADAVSPRAACGGLAVGVDISVDRLFVARSLVKKHWPHRDSDPPAPVCLFAADGCTFTTKAARDVLDVSPKSVLRDKNGLTAFEERQLKRMRDGANAKRPMKRAREQDMSRVLLDAPTAAAVFAPAVARGLCLDPQWDGLYDRVLVDAECSHDGSISHLSLKEDHIVPKDEVESRGDSLVGPGGLSNEYRMQRINTYGTPQKCPSDDQLSSGTALLSLQLALVTNGYKQLRRGGTMLYCTCSFSYQQNEHVMHAFLDAVNASSFQAESGARAVLVPAFDYRHEDGHCDGALADCMQFSCDGADNFKVLQEYLDDCKEHYGITQRGAERFAVSTRSIWVGSRFWPLEFKTSFQYIAKIWKEPIDNTL